MSTRPVHYEKSSQRAVLVVQKPFLGPFLAQFASHNAGAASSPVVPYEAVGSPNFCGLLVGLNNDSRGAEMVHNVR